MSEIFCFGRRNYSIFGRRIVRTQVDEISVFLGRRFFSGRRNFCPLVDEMSVLKVSEMSVSLGRRNVIHPFLKGDNVDNVAKMSFLACLKLTRG